MLTQAENHSKVYERESRLDLFEADSMSSIAGLSIAAVWARDDGRRHKRQKSSLKSELVNLYITEFEQEF